MNAPTHAQLLDHVYERDLERNPANYQPLSPLTFLKRAAAIYLERTAVVHGALRRSYAEFYARCRKLASALEAKGIGDGDTVAVIAPNVPAMLELHFAVPMLGAVLNTVNIRLDAAAIAFILDHGEAKALFVDREFSALGAEALELAAAAPFVLDIDDPEYDGEGTRIARPNTKPSSPPATRPIPGSCRGASGPRSASTTRPAPPAIRRASSTTIAAPICLPWAISSPRR